MKKYILILTLLLIAYLVFDRKSEPERFEFINDPDFADRSERLLREGE